MRSRHRCSRHGGAAVEFALVLPLILAMLVGIWELGRMIEVQQTLTNAAREGGRRAATGQWDQDAVKQAVHQYLDNAGYPTDNVEITVTNLDRTGTDPREAEQGDRLRITVSLPFRDIRWATISLFVSGDKRLEGKTVWFCLKDKEFPTFNDPDIE